MMSTVPTGGPLSDCPSKHFPQKIKSEQTYLHIKYVCDTRSNSVKGLIPECQHGTHNPAKPHICTDVSSFATKHGFKEFPWTHEPTQHRILCALTWNAESNIASSMYELVLRNWWKASEAVPPTWSYFNCLSSHWGQQSCQHIRRKGKGKWAESLRQTADKPPPQNEEETHASMLSMYCKYFHRTHIPSMWGFGCMSKTIEKKSCIL